MPRALVRRPSSRLADGLVTHITRQPVDVELAERQWGEYVETLIGGGWQITYVPPADDCPDGVFVEDTAVVFGDFAVVTRPGAPTRQSEIAGMPELLTSLHLEVAHVEPPATLDGGDVLKVGTDVYVGLSGRTNADGVRQLRRLVGPRGYSVIAVPVSKVLHLKSAVTALPDRTVIGYEPLVDDIRVFPRFRPMPEPSGAHVVILDEHRLLMAADCPDSVKLVESLGYDVVVVDIGEFEKLEACVTCLSIRLRTEP